MPEQTHYDALDNIRERLRADLKPVRPLQSERLCLGVSFLFILVSIALLSAVFGLRPDREALGMLWLWGPSILEILVALMAFGLAMRESLPGRSSSPGVLLAAAGAGLTCHVASALLVSERSTMSAAEHSNLLITMCESWLALCFGIPMVLAAIWIAKRGNTAQPGRVGLMAGVGAALAVDAIWRLFCPFSEASHIFTSHTLAIIIVVLVGWYVADWWRRRMLIARSEARHGGRSDSPSL